MSSKASKKEIVAKFEILKAAAAAARKAADVERTPAARRAAVAASRAVSDFAVAHNLIPKARGFASRAGQRQAAERAAATAHNFAAARRWR